MLKVIPGRNTKTSSTGGPYFARSALASTCPNSGDRQRAFVTKSHVNRPIRFLVALGFVMRHPLCESICPEVRVHMRDPSFIIKVMSKNSFGAAAKLRVGDAEFDYFRLARLEQKGVGHVGRLPFSIKILLENLLRHEDGRRVSARDVEYVASGAVGGEAKEISFMPARVLLQDFTGVPCVVD